jgi:arylsulfatase A-like enzyme
VIIGSRNNARTPTTAGEINSPLKDNTIIILTSDHGWQMGQKDYVYKNSLWEETTRVPLIIRVPGVTKGGATSHPVSLVDIYPTLVDLCGLNGDTRKNAKGRPLDGHSLKPFLLDPSTGKWAGPDAALTALFRWAKTHNPSEQSYTLRSKDWRNIRYSNGKEGLYDHVNDPHEWTNLAGNPEHPARLAIFRKQLTQRQPRRMANLPRRRRRPRCPESRDHWQCLPGGKRRGHPDPRSAQPRHGGEPV